jgi:hypothetical protein
MSNPNVAIRRYNDMVNSREVFSALEWLAIERWLFSEAEPLDGEHRYFVMSRANDAQFRREWAEHEARNVAAMQAAYPWMAAQA